MFRYTKEFLSQYWTIFKTLYISFGVLVAIAVTILTFSAIFFEIAPFLVVLAVDVLLTFAYLASLIANNLTIGVIIVTPFSMLYDYLVHKKVIV